MPHAPRPGHKIRERFIGVLLLALVAVLAGAMASHRISNESEFLGVLSRMIESMRVMLFALAAFLALCLVVLGARLTGVLALVVMVAGAGGMAVDYLSRTAPRGDTGDMAILWFNLLKTNGIAPEKLEAALRESGADLVVLTEADAARDVIAPLSDLYPHRAGCRKNEGCNLLILSRKPLQDLEMRDFPLGPDRLVRFGVEGRTLSFVAVHMGKPWYILESAREIRILEEILGEERGEEPIVVMGDFNAAPWSRRLRSLERRHDLLHPRVPVPTWPPEAGAAGIPIDHVLMRGDVGLTSISPWGDGLRSNHRGLLFSIDLP